MQNNFLVAKASKKPHSFAEALSLRARLGLNPIKLKNCTTLDELKTLAISQLKEHFASKKANCDERTYIAIYELHSTLLGKNLIFFNTKGEELGTTPKDFCMWQKNETGIISILQSDNQNTRSELLNKAFQMRKNKAFESEIKAHKDKVEFIRTYAKITNNKMQQSYVFYALDRDFSLYQLLFDLACKFKIESFLFALNGRNFKQIFTQQGKEKQDFKTKIWLKNGAFNKAEFVRLMKHFQGEYKLLRFDEMKFKQRRENDYK